MKTAAQNRRAQLEELASFQLETRARLRAQFEEEALRQKEAGMVWICGEWVPQSEAMRVRRQLSIRGAMIFFETNLVLVLLLIAALVIWVAFMFMLSPYPPNPRMGMKKNVEQVR